MQRKLLLATIVLLVFAGSFLVRGLLNGPNPGEPDRPQSARRIVSMAPSITETLFALGLGDRIVGVTRFCKIPPDVEEPTRIGGLLDLNLEALVALKPDMVVMLRENEAMRPTLQRLGIPSLIVSHQTIGGILDSITSLGDAFGEKDQAQDIVDGIRRRLRRVEEKTAGRKRPKVMVAIYRSSAGSGKLEGMSVAGADEYFDRMIAMAGGENVCHAAAARFPIVANEGILWMDPEVIVDIVPPENDRKVDRQAVLSDWQEVAEVAAVRNGRVHVLDKEFAYVPGPRFVELVEALARLLHPELDWSTDD